jgi:RimJ/RimL family protein N-acetyltransferase
VDHELNELGQPVGLPLPDWQPPASPSREPMAGRFCRLELPQPAIHAAPLHEANALDHDGRMWTYLGYGPFATVASYRLWMEQTCCGHDPMFQAIIDPATAQPVGLASYLRIDPRAGSIEIGHLAYSPLLQRKSAATEAMFLMMDDLGYRRLEWKCNALNEPSRAAALRLGFTFEGVFRQAIVNKGRNRDTAWYSIIDSEWPALSAAYTRWLHPDNFDEQGRQRTRLSDRTAEALRARRGP